MHPPPGAASCPRFGGGGGIGPGRGSPPRPRGGRLHRVWAKGCGGAGPGGCLRGGIRERSHLTGASVLLCGAVARFAFVSGPGRRLRRGHTWQRGASPDLRSRCPRAWGAGLRAPAALSPFHHPLAGCLASKLMATPSRTRAPSSSRLAWYI